MNQAHLRKFIEFLPEALVEEQWVGNNIQNWWENYVCKHTKTLVPKGNLPDSQVSRDQLKKFCNKDSSHADWECLAAVMAWGGQNRKHGVMLFDRFDEIQPIISGIRQGELNYLEAYDEFYKVWLKPERLGMGAAYFTKLIFFCEPDHKGYIMDQWTSKSINLLTGEEIVHLTGTQVSKKNTADTYARFCELTNSIANMIQINEKQGVSKGEQVEIAMFSEGRKKGKWRNYVVAETGKKGTAKA